MDNGRVQKAQRISAKELTQEIDQATDWAVMGEAESSVAQGTAPGISQEAAREVLQAAEREIARDEDELVHAEDYVGEETAVQTRERLASEQENLLNEEDPDRDSEAKRMHQTQEKIAGQAMTQVDELMKNKVVSPADIEGVWREFGNRVLESYENPHPIGRGNG